MSVYFKNFTPKELNTTSIYNSLLQGQAECSSWRFILENKASPKIQYFATVTLPTRISACFWNHRRNVVFGNQSRAVLTCILISHFPSNNQAEAGEFTICHSLKMPVLKCHSPKFSFSNATRAHMSASLSIQTKVMRDPMLSEADMWTRVVFGNENLGVAFEHWHFKRVAIVNSPRLRPN